MRNWLKQICKSCFGLRTSSQSSRWRAASFKPTLEALEVRQLLSNGVGTSVYELKSDGSLWKSYSYGKTSRVLDQVVSIRGGQHGSPLYYLRIDHTLGKFDNSGPATFLASGVTGIAGVA